MQSLVQNLMTASAMDFGNLRFSSMPILTSEGTNSAKNIHIHLMLASNGRREGSGTASKASRSRAGHGYIVTMAWELAVKGTVHQKNFYRSNLIFWIEMRSGIADLGQRGL